MASSESRLVALGATCLLLACAGPRAATTAPVELGALPLVSTDGARAAVGELLARADATVLVFWSAGCPCVRRYQARVDDVAQTWAGRGVQVLQVASNAGESLESLRAAAEARALRLPVWRDEGGHLARQLGARSTPTVVLLRRDGEVLYRGWLDNEREPGTPGREAWLEAALEGARRGTPFAARSPTWGCTITRSLAAPEPPACHPPPEASASLATSPGGTP
jgi:hypothetical protein